MIGHEWPRAGNSSSPVSPMPAINVRQVWRVAATRAASALFEGTRDRRTNAATHHGGAVCNAIEWFLHVGQLSYKVRASDWQLP